MTLISRVAPGAWFFLVLWLALMAVCRERLFRDAGTFWHVRVGEIVLDSGRLVTTDPFTFTFGGTPWVPHGWLGEVGMAALHCVAGIDTLLLASAAIIAATYTLPFVRLTRVGLHWSVAGCIVGLALAASTTHFHARPHLLTNLFFAVVVARFFDFDAGRIRWAGLFWLMPLFAVWANVHGGVTAGYCSAGFVVAGWLGFRAVGWPSPVRGLWDTVWLIGWAALIALTMLATPYGVQMPLAWLAIVQMPELPLMIVEHAPIDPRDAGSWPFLALGVLYAALMAGLREKPRATWLLPVVWFVLGYQRVRNDPLFALAAVLVFADVFPRTTWAKMLAKRPDLYRPASESSPLAPRADSDLQGRESAILEGKPNPLADYSKTVLPGVALCVAVVLIVAGIQAAGARVPVVGAGWAAFPESEWPLSLVPALHREATGRTSIPAFNEYEFGGFLVYFAPQYRPFVDDRCEVFGGPWLMDFNAAKADPAPSIKRWEAEYGKFDIALVRPASGFDGYFAGNSDWVLVESAPAGNLYRRKGH